jgi:hypothetical protein
MRYFCEVDAYDCPRGLDQTRNNSFLYNYFGYIKRSTSMKRFLLLLTILMGTFLLSCNKDKQDNSKPIDEKYKEVKVEIIKELR